MSTENKNRVSVVINGRRYTLVAGADTEYIQGLADHVNEKVEEVLKEGQNVIGERPVVLAALNICDEFFKLYQASIDMQSEIGNLNDKLEESRKELQKAKETIKNTQAGQNAAKDKESDENLQKQLIEYSKDLKKATTTIKDLENKLKSADKKHKEEVERLKQDFKKREDEILAMIDSE